MAHDKLLRDDERHVDNASRFAITQYFATSFSSASPRHWLETSNRYIGDASEKFKKDFDAVPRAIHQDNLVSYIAASAPTHLIDGWSFYSRATESLLRGDSGAAIHLAYYAELRAAMSILASEGVGVFNNRHPVITSANTFEVIKKLTAWDANIGAHESKPINANTHRIIWPLLKYWSSTQKAANLIDSIIRPANINLSSWLVATKVLTPSSAIAEHLFSRWGIDLCNLHQDHQNRNAVSYQPSDLRVQTDPKFEDVLGFVCESWRFLQPGHDGRFVDLEKHLLKYAIGISHRAVIDGELIERALQISSGVAEIYESFLKENNESPLISLSTAPSDRSSPMYPLEILARSFLLLYIATGSVKQHFLAAGLTNFDFFWKRLLCTRLCYNEVDTAEDVLLLWEDLKDVVDATQIWVADNQGHGTLSRWRKENPEGANQIPGFELAAIWGLAA